MAAKGRLFVLSIESPEGSATFIPVACTRDLTITVGHESVDVTSRCSDGNRTLLEGAGTKTVDISVTGVVTNDAGIVLLESYAQTGKIAKYELTSADIGDKYAGSFELTNWERSASFNGEETFSATLTSSGEVTYTPSP